MISSLRLLTFEEAMALAERAADKKHVLLGNGFSTGAHRLFRYKSLYDQACKAGLSRHVQKVFDKFGTTNFEAVLQRLVEGDWLAKHYKLTKTLPGLDMLRDYARVRKALITALTISHPAFPSVIGDDKLAAAGQFLSRFRNVFTVNYDLLLYWAVMAKKPYRSDGFGKGVDTRDDYCVFLPSRNPRRGMYFLHGGLHLYAFEGEVHKMVSVTPLMEQVKEALDEKRYPLIVSEGDSRSKKSMIGASSYLSHCQQQFSRVDGSLFVYGWSMSDEDAHIRQWIAENAKVRRLFVGIHGNPRSESNLQLVARARSIVARRKKILGAAYVSNRLYVHFFDSRSAGVWVPKREQNPLAA